LALAVEESAARLIREANIAGRAPLIRELLEAQEPRMAFATAHNLRRTLEREARQDGQGEGAVEDLRRSGALLRWRVVGPFGPFATQSFDVAHPPEGDDHLADSYDLGPGRGEQPTRDPEMSASSVQLLSPIGQSGTWYAETAIQVEHSGPVDLRLWVSPNVAVSVTVGEVEAIRRDGRMAFEPDVSLAQVELEAGQPVRLRVKLGAGARDPAFNISLRDVQGTQVQQLDPASGPWAGSARLLEQPDLLDSLRPAPGEEVSALRALVVSAIARSRGHSEVADEVLHRLLGEPTPLMLIQRAVASGSSPSAPSSIREDRLLSDMRVAFQGDPGLWRARMVLARQLMSEDQGRAAIELLQHGLELRAEQPDLWHEIGVIARRIGLHNLAEEAFGNALSFDERACASLHHLALMYDDVNLDRQRDATLERLIECDATYATRAELLARSSRPLELIEDIRRLQQIDEYPNGFDSDLASAMLAAGQLDAAAEILERLAQRWPRSNTYVAGLADIAGVEGGLPAVVAHLRPQIEQYPWEMGGLRRMAAVAGAQREIPSWRVDGLDQIVRYARSNAQYDAPSVYVLDRAVYRIFPDMSSMELVHQIVHVVSQEAVGALSEFQAPEGAEVLTLRTIKADGRILEPLSYDDEGTTNLASVEMGDYVEWEYVITRRPSTAFPGGLQTPRFYFATSDTAMHLSEMIVLVPEGVDVDYVGRGPAPPEAQPIRLGGLSGVRFAVERIHSQSREPAMPSINEAYSSIGVVARESPRSLVQSWSDGLIAAQRVDWRMRDLLRELRRPGQTEVELARAIYDYVLEHVQQGRGGTPASATLSLGHGDLMLLVSALLREAGFDSEIIYAWDLSDDRSGPYMVPAELDDAMLRVTLDDEVWWIYVASRHAPFGHIPSQLRGQPGMVADFEAADVVIPEISRIPDLVRITMDSEIQRDGTVSGHVEERFLGARATEFRSQITRIPEAERATQAAAILGRQSGGGVAEEVEFEGIDDRHVPMVLSANVTSRMIARREGRALLLPARLGQGLRYAMLVQISERDTPLVFDQEIHEAVVQRVRLPEGARVDQLCPGEEQQFGPASFSVSCTQEGNVLIHRFEIDLPPQRITPAEYPRFAEFLRLFDEAVGQETRISF
jgi:tetratricopeptide (TPR) repeat protein